MGKPKPPDPKKTAAGQTASSIGTNVANISMFPTQSTPFGTSSTEQTGSMEYKDPYSGETFNIPTFETGTTFSEPLQNIFNKIDRGDDRLYSLGEERIAPRFAERRAQMETQLANQGVTPGSEAWRRRMAELSDAENSAYTDLELTAYNNPTQQIISLLSGVPMGGPTPSMPMTDVAGLEMDNYRTKAANYGNLMGGLLGAGGTLLGAPSGSLGHSLLGGMFGGR